MDKKLIDEWKKLNNVLIGTTKGGRNNQYINFVSNGRVVSGKCFGDVPAGDVIALRTDDGQWHVKGQNERRKSDSSFFRQIQYRKNIRREKQDSYLRRVSTVTGVNYLIPENGIFAEGIATEEKESIEPFFLKKNIVVANPDYSFLSGTAYDFINVNEESYELTIENSININSQSNFYNSITNILQYVFFFDNCSQFKIEYSTQIFSNLNGTVSSAFFVNGMFKESKPFAFGLGENNFLIEFSFDDNKEANKNFQITIIAVVENVQGNFASKINSSLKLIEVNKDAIFEA